MFTYVLRVRLHNEHVYNKYKLVNNISILIHWINSQVYWG